jgi:Flp pilus assembly protein TadG
MTYPRRQKSRRPGTAAVEFAVLLPFLVILLMGLWEVGRIVMVQNIIDNAAREGARLSASGAFWASNNTVSPIDGSTMSSNYSVDSSNNQVYFDIQKRVLTYINQAGLNTTGATVLVYNYGNDSNQFTGSPASTTKTWNYTWTCTTPPFTGSGSGSGSDPCMGASQLDHLKVTVTVPYNSIAWSTAAYFIPNPAQLTATSDWYSGANVPLTVSTTIPQSPLQSTSALP